MVRGTVRGTVTGTVRGREEVRVRGKVRRRGRVMVWLLGALQEVFNSVPVPSIPY